MSVATRSAAVRFFSGGDWRAQQRAPHLTWQKHMRRSVMRNGESLRRTARSARGMAIAVVSWLTVCFNRNVLSFVQCLLHHGSFSAFE